MSASTELERREEAFWNSDYLRAIVVPLLRPSPHSVILDVGCGQGGLVLELARLFPDARYVGVDLDEAYLDIARRRAETEGLTNIEFRQGDALTLAGLDDGSFDVVCCQTLLANVPNPETAVRQMARVLKPGGVFLAVEHWDPGVRALINNVTTPHRGEDWHADFFRLFRLRNRGKRQNGAGDDQVGLQVPFIAQQAGLLVTDVRLNDHVAFALDGVNKTERGYLHFFDGYLKERFENAKGILVDPFILAAQGSPEDAERYSRKFPNSPEEAQHLRDALKANTYQVVFAKFAFLTFAQKRPS